jgi:glycosyltransferase involved in cell wall biosynthesis
MENNQVSLVIITLNEQANIERCIRSVPFAEDIVVLDSGSEDRTIEIAKSLGARVFIEPFRGYQKQKVRATSLARFPWVVSLDADEALGEAAQAEIKELLEKPLEFDAYEFPRLSFHLGRWIRHGGWYPDRQIRFFNKERCQWREGHLHERVKAEKVQRMKHPILHWVFKDLSDQVATNNEYSTLGSRDLMARGDRFSLLKLIFKPVSKFVETYILKRGFKDGMPGFIISVGAAYSMFLKHAKLWEQQQKK